MAKTVEKLAKIEKEQRKKHKCPYCSALRVRRVSFGIWRCEKCNAKFTGKAYSVEKKISFEKEEVREEEPKAEPEEE